METTRTTEGSKTHFIIADADPKCHDAIRGLAYFPLGDGFGKTYPANTPGLDGIYGNFENHAEEMVLQAADVVRTPWEDCLLVFIERVEPHNIDWWLCGSAALAVRGMAIVPHDLDLVVSDGDSVRLGEVLADCMIEPVVPVEGWFCNWFGRAFLHARLEWVGGVDERADSHGVSDFGPTAQSRLDTVEWRGKEVRVPPLDLQLAVNRRRGLNKRVELIEHFLSDQS